MEAATVGAGVIAAFMAIGWGEAQSAAEVKEKPETLKMMLEDPENYNFPKV